MTSPRKTKLPPPRHPLENRNSAPDIGKDHALKSKIFCDFKNGKQSVFVPEKSLKLPKILFCSAQKLHIW